MGTVRVGIREFREELASYLLESETPVAITRHGDTVGYYIPARRKGSDAERAALRCARQRPASRRPWPRRGSAETRYPVTSSAGVVVRE